MLEQQENVDREALDRLSSAAMGFARAEIDRIVDVVVCELQDWPALGMFADVAVRHLWDEYSWARQNGEFSDAFDETVQAWVHGTVEELPKHALVLLTVWALEEQCTCLVDDDGLGSIWIDGIVSVVLDKVKAKASWRRLDLIGPHREHVIGSEIEGSGMVWSILSDRREVMDIVSEHCDALIAPDGDLSLLADEMVEAFVVAAKEEGEEGEGVLSEFLERFEDQVRTLVLDHDVLPTLENIRGSLQERLDE